MADSRSLVIFGCGYVGGYLARAALADGQRVRVCARNLERLARLGELGAEVRGIDAARHKQFGPALIGVPSPVVVYSIPPPPGVPAGESVRRAGNAALAAGASAFVYLGTTGVYGNRASEEWVDEDTSIDLGDEAMGARRADEMALQSLASAGLHSVILRLAAIYGPGRGVRERLRRGDYRLSGEGEMWFSRIHVLDLVTVIRAALASTAAPPLTPAVYCVADDRPSRQREYAGWLAAHLHLPPPASGAAPTAHRGRRVKNERMKRELGVTLRYGSFVEGEQQIDEAEAAAVAPPSP